MASGGSGLWTPCPGTYRFQVQYLRRATGLLLLLLLAQLTLVGSGYTCTAAMASEAGSETGEMPGMPGMAGMSGESAPPNGEAPATSPEDLCTFPWAPTGCALMVPCAPHALSAHVSASVAAAARHDAAPAWRAAIPPSPILTPDPPPPRA